MRLFWILVLSLFVFGLAHAQDEREPYEIALERIERAQETGLSELILADLGLRELPPEIGRLVNLERLSLGDNQLSSLPPEIVNLSNLDSLFLGNNQFS